MLNIFERIVWSFILLNVFVIIFGVLINDVVYTPFLISAIALFVLYCLLPAHTPSENQA
jgi:hypothetical protein